MKSHFPIVFQYACTFFVLCVICRAANSQDRGIETRPRRHIGLHVDGEARLFVSEFREAPCIAELSESVGFATNEIRYFVCPKSLSLVRINLVFSLDKSRYTFLLRPVTDRDIALEFQEIKIDKLRKLGLDPEVIFGAMFPANVGAGMGATIGPILEVHISKDNINAFRKSLLQQLPSPLEPPANSKSLKNVVTETPPSESEK